MHCYAALITKYYVIVGFHFFSAQLWYHIASAKVCLCLALFNTVPLHYNIDYTWYNICSTWFLDIQNRSPLKLVRLEKFCQKIC